MGKGAPSSSASLAEGMARAAGGPASIVGGSGRTEAGSSSAAGSSARAAGASPLAAGEGPVAAGHGSSRSSYTTLRAGVEAQAEFVDRKSRFIAQVVNVESEAEAAEFVAAVRSRHYDARHNVPAWILADGSQRASDDGEPQRTAGMPVLEVLGGAGLADVCCVVTRYFGGVLLGPGGLVRAYSEATARAVEAAREQGLTCEMTLVVPVVLAIPYAMHDRVRNLAERAGGRVRSCDYGADVTLTLAFRAGEEAAFVSRLRELFAGDDPCLVLDAEFSEF